MNLLELLVLCVSIYISFAGTPSYNPINSLIDESSLQSVLSTGPWITETVPSSQTLNSSFLDEGSSKLMSSSASLISEAISSSQILSSSGSNEKSSELIASLIDDRSSQSSSNSELASMISIPSSSIANESSSQSVVSSNSSGPWLYDTVDTRPPCITCYVLFKTNQNTTRKCNPNHKFIWELWYNVSGVQRGGYCIEFESLKNIEEIDPKITSVIATSVPSTSSGSVGTGGGGVGGGSTTIYQWSKGQEITVKTSVLPDCVPCYDFLHIFPKLSPFECDPGNYMKVKVTYEVFTGIEETGYCAGQITMSDRELRNIQKLFWTEKKEETKCEECANVITFGKNASKEFCDSGNERIWHVQYYKQNWSLAMDGYCINTAMYHNPTYWSMMDGILFGQIYRLDLSGYYSWMSRDATEIEKTTCKPCAKIIYDHKNLIDECKPNGHPLWQVWFNNTYGESYAGYCIDFMLIDLNLLADKYITYILASNETTSYEWFSSGSELNLVTESYPPCVNCSELADANTYLSSFYCDPRNQTKVKVDFTTVADKNIRGYCSGFFYNYTVGKTQYKPTHIEMYDIFNIYSWNERCVDCYDVFMLGSRVSRLDCDTGNETLWRSYYIKQQYYTSYNPEFIVDGYCINFNLSYLDTWEFPVDISYIYVATMNNWGSEYKSDYWYRQDCVSCYNALVNGYSLSHKRCITGGEPRWHVSFTFSYYNYPSEGYCVGISPESLDSWNIREGIQSINAENGTETYSWHKPSPSPMECISCYDALVYGSSLSHENCYTESDQRWQIEIYYTYYYHYYYQRSFGYCKGLDSESFNIWSINDGFGFIYANNGNESHYYYKSYSSLSSSSSSDTYSDFSSYTSEPLRCLSCYEILLYRSSYNSNCDPQGQTLWDIWFNSTDAFTDGGFCVDFLETDFTGIGDSITYIRASNESSTIEWFKSDPVLKEITEAFPACVSCSDVASSDVNFSPFDCDPEYRYKVRARYTNSLGEDSIGYCVGVGSYDFSSKNITHVTLYDRFGTYNMPNSGFAT